MVRFMNAQMFVFRETGLWLGDNTPNDLQLVQFGRQRTGHNLSNDKDSVGSCIQKGALDLLSPAKLERLLIRFRRWFWVSIPRMVQGVHAGIDKPYTLSFQNLQNADLIPDALAYGRFALQYASAVGGSVKTTMEYLPILWSARVVLDGTVEKIVFTVS